MSPRDRNRDTSGPQKSNYVPPPKKKEKAIICQQHLPYMIIMQTSKMK